MTLRVSPSETLRVGGACALRLRQSPAVGKPQRESQLPRSGNPPAALVSPPAALAH
ncbi:hypothetical protein [Scytonema sp. PCC 10023]|uniref:hypothetical protein n=1 Tax=Scytonema sp. PCC 10023 TaxID=1680591 RepID=UPI0039C6141A